MTKSLIEQQRAMAGMSKDLLKSQTDMIQLKNQLPNEHQNNIDMYGQLSDATGYKQRPNEPWRALLDGMFKGVAMGEKSEMSKKARENYETLEKGTAFMMDWGKAIKEQSDYVNKKEKIKEVAAPYAIKLIEGNFSISDPKEKKAYMQEVIDQLAIIDPKYQGIKARSMDQNSALLNYTTADGKFGSVDLVELIGRERYKDISDKYLENINLNISQQNANSSAMQAQARMMSAETGRDNNRLAQERLHMDQEYAPKEQEDRTRRLDIMQQNAHQRLEALGIKSVKEIAPKYEAAIMGKKICEDLIEEAKDNPEVFGSIASAVVNTKGDSNALRLWAEKTFVDPKQRSAAMRVAKGIASLQLQDAKAMGGQNNMTLDAMIQQMIPNGQYDPDNFIYIMEEYKNKYQFRIDTTRDFLRQPSNSYIGESYDNHMQDFENRSKTNRDNLDNPNKFSKHSPEQLQVRKQQLEQEIMSKK